MPGGWKRDARTPSRTATPQHRAWRRAVLERDNYLCQLAYPGCQRTATQADHRVEVADDGPEFDLANGQAACEHCHKIKTTKHANAKRWQVREKREQEKHPGLR